MSSARADAARDTNRCLCGCGEPVTVPRKKNGFRYSRRHERVRYYASRACSLKMARAAKVRFKEAA